MNSIEPLPSLFLKIYLSIPRQTTKIHPFLPSIQLVIKLIYHLVIKLSIKSGVPTFVRLAVLPLALLPAVGKPLGNLRDSHCLSRGSIDGRKALI